MDSKEIKSLLKEARDAIRAKDFRRAIKQCKVILAEDKDNYNALVFVGVSAEGMEEPGQALQAYRKAAEISPEQPLAWQGLCAMMDKNIAAVENVEAVKIYKKVIEFNKSDTVKKASFCKRLALVYTKMGETEKALELCTDLLQSELTETESLEIRHLVIRLLSPISAKLSPEHLSIYEESLNCLVSSNTLEKEDADEIIYLFLLQQSRRNCEIVAVKSDELHHQYPASIVPLRFALQFYLDWSIGDNSPDSEIKEKVEKYIEKCKELAPDCTIVKTGKAFLAYHTSNIVEAQELLEGLDEPLICSHYYLSLVYLKLHQNLKCLNACKKGLSLCEKENRILCCPISNAENIFKLAQVEAHRGVGTAESRELAFSIIEEVVEIFPTCAFLLKAYILLDQGDTKTAEECYSYLPPSDPSVKTLKAHILFQQNLLLDAFYMLRDVIADNEQNGIACLRLGAVLLSLQDCTEIDNVKQLCFTHLLKAAKLDPYNYECFLYLGHFYKNVQQDLSKSKRCYQKAYDLNPANEETGIAFVDALQNLEEEEIALSVLKTITNKAVPGSAKWAWLRLGLQQLKTNESTSSITSLQAALRADPQDYYVWECLGDAYFHRGSYTASLKAFTKASELNPDSIYCRYQIAYIKQVVGSEDESVVEYKLALEKAPGYMPILKGLSESLLHVARRHLRVCLDGLAQDRIEETVQYLTRAISQRPDLSCLWKLMGDACLLAHRLASDAFRVPGKLVDKSASTELITVSKSEFLQISSRSFSQALKLIPECAALWHDLALSLFYQSKAHIEKEKESSLAQKALTSMKKAVQMDPKEWRHWNALGVLACSRNFSNYALAQHCFIKSIECEANNAMAWTNLGSLYMNSGDIELAHDAFKCAQSADPTYINCWIGQAMIAEIVGHEEAMDLFRHTTDLGFHHESAFGYAHWVLSVLADKEKHNTEHFDYCIKQMYAVATATDSLVKYTVRVKENAKAFNLKGLLLEHQKLYKSAALAYRKALGLIQKSEENNSGLSLNDMLVNIARVLSKQGKNKEALECFQRCDVKDDFSHLCIYASTVYNNGQYAESYKLYSQAVDLAKSDEQKSQVYAALGMISYQLGDLDEAKSQLFNSFETSEPSFDGLLALCSLGMLQRDSTLISAVLQELRKNASPVHSRELTLVEIYNYILEENKNTGLEILREKGISQKSSDILLVLAHILISETRSQEALECLLEALSYSHTSQADEIHGKLCLTYLQGGYHSKNDMTKNSFKSAQRVFHLNPGDPKNSALFASALGCQSSLVFKESTKKNLLDTQKGSLDFNLPQFETTQDLYLWCLQERIINCLRQSEFKSAQIFTDQFNKTQDKNESAFAKTVETCISGKPENELLSLSSSNRFYLLSLLVIVECFISSNDFQGAVKHLLEIIEKLGNSNLRMLRPVVEILCYVSFEGMKTQQDHHLNDMFEKSLLINKEKELKSPIVSILHGIKNKNTNIRLSKHCFATALDNVENKLDIGFTATRARQSLLDLLKDSTKPSDQQLVQALLEEEKKERLN